MSELFIVELSCYSYTGYDAHATYKSTQYNSNGWLSALSITFVTEGKKAGCYSYRWVNCGQLRGGGGNLNHTATLSSLYGEEEPASCLETCCWLLVNIAPHLCYFAGNLQPHFLWVVHCIVVAAGLYPVCVCVCVCMCVCWSSCYMRGLE